MKRTIIIVAVVAVTALSVTALAQRAKEAETLFHRGVHFEEVRGELKEAIAIFEQLVKDYPENRPLAAKAYYHLGICYEKLGRTQAADAFKAIVEKYPDQTETVRLAREKLSLLAKPEAALEEVSQELKISLVWQGEGMDSTGEISPDGKYLSFVDWTTGDLAVRDMATGEVRRLTSKEGLPSSPYEFPDPSIWAPDSNQIAYVWYRDGDFVDVRVIGLDGSKPRVLFRGDYFKDWVRLCDWSPDGRSILAKFNKAREHGGPSRQLGLVSVQDGSVRYLDGMREGGLGSVKFSSDGRYLVFDQPQEGNPEVYDIAIIALEGGNPIPVIDHQADDRLLGWSPDGRGVLFTSNRTGTWDAWMIGVADGKPQGVPRLIKRELGWIKPMGLTQGGSLYYSTPGFEWDIFSVSIDPSSGKLTDPPKKVPLLHEGRNTFPALSPDGKRLAYMSERPGMRSDVLCVYSFDTGETLEIRPKGAFHRFVFPHWMPDGSSILVSGEEMTRGRGFFRVDLETGNLMDFLNFNDVFGKDQAGNVGGIRISPDARSIYYLLNGPGPFRRVMTRRLGAEEDKEIFRFPLESPSESNRLQLSPDGRRLALALREGKDAVLKVFPAAGGEIKEILRTGQTGGVGGFVWSQDGRYIYFIVPVDPEHDEWKTALWRIPSSGGNPENLGLTSNRFVTLCVHPDGKRIFYASRTADEPGGAAIWAMENFLPAAEPKDFTVRRVYQQPGSGFVGSPSPDNRYFSDVDWESGNLVVRDLSTGQQRFLTKNSGDWLEYALGSMFSPNGKTLAYTWYDEAGRFEIRTIGVDGSGIRTLIGDLDVRNTAPIGWSADGQYVTTFNQTGAATFEIARVPAREGDCQILKTLEGIGSAPCLSPDSRYLAYDRPRQEDSQNLDVFVCPVEGGNEILFVVHEANDTVLGWTPDGKAVLFASDRTGSNDAWIIPVDKGKPQGPPKLVRKDIGQVVPLGFAKNGSFYYGVQAGLSDVFAAALDVAAAKMLSPPVPVSKRLVGRNDSPAWSPDGKYLAYILRSTSWTKSLLCLQSTESGEERDLEPEMNFRWPLWSPDGRRILVWGRKEPNDIGFYFIDPQTGSAEPFVLGTQGIGLQQAAWSPDGRFIFFRRFSADLEEGWYIKRDVESGQETELLHNYPINESALSPDGQRIVFRSYDKPDTTLKTMSTSGEDIRVIVRVKNPEYIPGYSGLAWSPDGRYVLYFKARQTHQNSEETELWRVDVETGECRPFGLTMERMRNLTLHPDGKRVAFDSGMPKVEIWVMENFLDKD